MRKPTKGRNRKGGETADLYQRRIREIWRAQARTLSASVKPISADPESRNLLDRLKYVPEQGMCNA